VFSSLETYVSEEVAFVTAILEECFDPDERVNDEGDWYCIS
jgi:hypothetical protein